MSRTARVTSTALGPAAHEPPHPQFRSAAFVRVLERIQRFAAHPSIPVLLEGEAGTGKTSLARRLHELSPRAALPFAHVVLSAVDDALAGSELFGHRRGAFTDARATRLGQFASAHHGTLFLDEIGKASRAVQQKLLHAIEYREIRPVGSDRTVPVDVRIVAATNVNLQRLVDEGSFLPDLNARLEMYRLVIPPLRQRRADIPLLVDGSLKRYAADCGYAHPPAVDEDLMLALRSAPWPNNVRQLDATVHRLLIEAAGAPMIELSHCCDDLEYLRGEVRRPLTPEAVAAAIAEDGNVTKAAKRLRVDRTTVHRHLRRPRPHEG